MSSSVSQLIFVDDASGNEIFRYRGTLPTVGRTVELPRKSGLAVPSAEYDRYEVRDIEVRFRQVLSVHSVRVDIVVYVRKLKEKRRKHADGKN